MLIKFLTRISSSILAISIDTFLVYIHMTQWTLCKKHLEWARYSQLYMDRGSGYLWAYRMTKKTGHYTETPKVLSDSQALSGRPVQIFHSDGEGVFASKVTSDLLQKEKIRHEFSAPYDSNTNPFVERARVYCSTPCRGLLP